MVMYFKIDYYISNKLEKILLRGGRECAHRGGVVKMLLQIEEG